MVFSALNQWYSHVTLVTRVVADPHGYQLTLLSRHLDLGIKRYDHYGEGCHESPLLS